MQLSFSLLFLGENGSFIFPFLVFTCWFAITQELLGTFTSLLLSCANSKLSSWWTCQALWHLIPRVAIYTIYQKPSRSPRKTLGFFGNYKSCSSPFSFFTPRSVPPHSWSLRHVHWCYLIALARSLLRKESLLCSTQAGVCFKREAVKVVAEPGTDPRSCFSPALTFSTSPQSCSQWEASCQTATL